MDKSTCNNLADRNILIFGYNYGGQHVYNVQLDYGIKKIIFSASLNPYNSFIRILTDPRATQEKYPVRNIEKIKWLCEEASVLGSAGVPRKNPDVTVLSDIWTHFSITMPKTISQIIWNIDTL